jgi:hypothetical protein
MGQDGDVRGDAIDLHGWLLQLDTCSRTHETYRSDEGGFIVSWRFSNRGA